MKTALNRSQLVRFSSANPNAPYGVDPQLTFYCPQENLDALDLPVVRRFLTWAQTEYQPPPADGPAVLLLLPCQKVKPYALSAEHRAINAHLIARGFGPSGRGDWPDQLSALAPEALLSNASLKGRGLRIDRAVISEPFGFVPHSAMYRWKNRLSPCAQYDDPGLFEHRGLACPWRSDSTALAHDGHWRWGDNERASYVDVHKRIAESMAKTLGRIAPRYEAIYAYVAPAMTHRSFLVDRAERKAAGLALARQVGSQMRALVGVNDIVPGLVRVIPDARQLARLRRRMGGRLPSKLLSTNAALELLTTTIGGAR